MRFLLDTCVVSEFISRQPSASVVQWLDDVDEELLHLSVITIGEINRGIHRLPASRRKRDLRQWLDAGLLTRFHNRILTVDTPIMLVWGELVADLESRGRSQPVMDSMIAATAIHHDLTLVTRNETDFADTGVAILNPW